MAGINFLCFRPQVWMGGRNGADPVIPLVDPTRIQRSPVCQAELLRKTMSGRNSGSDREQEGNLRDYRVCERISSCNPSSFPLLTVIYARAHRWLSEAPSQIIQKGSGSISPDSTSMLLRDGAGSIGYPSLSYSAKSPYSFLRGANNPG